MQTYFSRHFDTALQLIASYDGSSPLNIYLKSHFSLHKKYGSKDRKSITHICYCYYRLGYALRTLEDDERLRIAVYLCTDKRGDWLSFYSHEWRTAYDEDLSKRIQFIQSLYTFSVKNIFFNNEWLNDDIDVDSFNQSHLIQPLLFIRTRPQKMDGLVNKLKQHKIVFNKINDTCIALLNTTNINTVIDLNKEAVVQDYSSQKVASLFSLVSLAKPFSAWDCCAASGGKSILLFDYFPKIDLTVSDIRTSILYNLQRRFHEARITRYTSFMADVSASDFYSKQQYDLVICDAPCSGSGTWSRTPEQLYFFSEDKLSHYIQLQKKITKNVAKAVKPNGYLLYITCSVFIQENEEIVKYIQEISKLKLIQAAVIKGYNLQADTMFAAIFINE